MREFWVFILLVGLSPVLRLPVCAQDTSDFDRFTAQFWEYRYQEPQKAMQVADSALTMSRMQNNPCEEAKALKHLGIINAQFANYSVAGRVYKDALQKAMHCGNTELTAEVLNNEGELLRAQGKRTDAFERYYKALGLYNAMGNKTGMANSYNNMGAIYLSQQNHKMSLSCFSSALQLMEEDGNVSGMSNILNSLGAFHSRQKNFGEAEQKFKKSLELAQSLNDLNKQAVTYSNLGELYMEQNLLAEAETAYHQALVISKKIENQALVARSLLYIATCKFKQNNFFKATAMAEEALTIAENKNISGIKIAAYRKLADMYAARGMVHKAYDYQNRLLQQTDSVGMQRLEDERSMIQFLYESEIKEKEILLLKHKNAGIAAELKHASLLKKFYVTGAVFLLLLLLTALSAYSYKRNSAKLLEKFNRRLADERREILKKNEAMQRQNKMLQEADREKDNIIGITAHDLRAPLNRILGFLQLLSLKQDNFDSDQLNYLEKIHLVTTGGLELIRRLLDIRAIETKNLQLNIEPVDLKKVLIELISANESLAALKRIRFNFHHRAGHAEAQTDRNHLTQILDNLISNAIKFSPKDRNLYVDLYATDQSYTISIRDEGQGIKESEYDLVYKKFKKLSAIPTAGESSTGLGLFIVKKLVDELKADISFESEERKGTVFYVKIPEKWPEQ